MEREQRTLSWQALTEEVLTGMREWHTAHPKASFAELEVAVEERLGRLRVRMLEDAALRGWGVAEGGADGVAGTNCPDCGAGGD